jgi:ornithine cyclodeaminase
MRFLNGPQVREALSMQAAIEAMRSAFSDDVEFPQRVLLGRSLFMPGRAGDLSAIKVVSTVPGSPSGTVVVFDSSGVPFGMVDGPTLTAIRTAAGAGLATDLLADPGVTSMAMLGAGAMAFDQIRAVQAVRDIDDLRIWSRNPKRAQNLAARFSNARAVNNADEAVHGVHVISTATPSRSPLFDAASVTQDVHVNAVGAFTPDMVEIPPGLVRSAYRVVDDRAAAAEEAGDLLQAGVEPDATMADLLAGRARPTHRPTLFKSVGIASQDVTAAAAAVRSAERSGIGTVLS